MFQSSNPGADASTSSSSMPFPATIPPTSPSSSSHESVRHMVFGTVGAVQHTIKLLHKLNYAEPNDWSKPIPTGQPHEVVAVLTKKVRLR
ncbi:MAG: hypothetical protein F6K09_35060 [Merismopedia sp. SIO2A8]|nr:hypothetical protein [Merismopedia sp. SIO2A8]